MTVTLQMSPLHSHVWLPIFHAEVTQTNEARQLPPALIWLKDLLTTTFTETLLLPRASLTSATVRCHGNFSVFRMLESKSQMSIHKGNEPADVVNQVRSIPKEDEFRLTFRRQVQDLQSQIAELTQMNSQLRTKVPDKEILEPERSDMKRRHSEVQSSTFPSPRRVPMPPMNDFEHVRRNVQKYARGIFTTPHEGRHDRVEPISGLPEVPLRAEFAQLTRFYLTTIHDWYPALHWPTFQHEADEVYASRSFEGMSLQWIGLFFAILACGSLQSIPDSRNAQSTAARGQTFFDIAAQALTPWPQEFSMTHAQAALLLSIFAVESNQKSIGSMWLASAVRIAQELELAPESNGWSAFDGEVRRRLWWAIYVRDRYVKISTNARGITVLT